MRSARRRSDARTAWAFGSVVTRRCGEVDPEQDAGRRQLVGHRREARVLILATAEARVRGGDDVVGIDLSVSVEDALIAQVGDEVDIERRAGRCSDDRLDVEIRFDFIAFALGTTIDEDARRRRPRPRDAEVAQKAGKVAVEKIGIDHVGSRLTGAVVRLARLAAKDLMLHGIVVALGKGKWSVAAMRAFERRPQRDIGLGARLPDHVRRAAQDETVESENAVHGRAQCRRQRRRAHVGVAQAAGDAGSTVSRINRRLHDGVDFRVEGAVDDRGRRFDIDDGAVGIGFVDAKAHALERCEGARIVALRRGEVIEELLRRQHALRRRKPRKTKRKRLHFSCMLIAQRHGKVNGSARRVTEILKRSTRNRRDGLCRHSKRSRRCECRGHHEGRQCNERR